ncbi:MAG: hypothetical protein ACRC1T_05435 [Clostridium chrysemydis]|uniref:hypothetical protein n=1 Tax=Clostridium chrysemydis TaxID=2665504 RepID=UPI003F2DF18E
MLQEISKEELKNFWEWTSNQKTLRITRSLDDDKPDGATYEIEGKEFKSLVRGTYEDIKEVQIHIRLAKINKNRYVLEAKGYDEGYNKDVRNTWIIEAI